MLRRCLNREIAARLRASMGMRTRDEEARKAAFGGVTEQIKMYNLFDDILCEII
jgi:hypothetical protein